MSWRSERTLKKICRSIARSSFSRCDAGTPTLDVGLVHASEQAVHLEQRFIDHRADRTQGVIRRYEVLQAAHREQALGEGIDSAHVWGLVCNCQGINFQRMCRIACRLAGSISAAC